jgi:hypothetical protein
MKNAIPSRQGRINSRAEKAPTGETEVKQPVPGNGNDLPAPHDTRFQLAVAVGTVGLLIELEPASPSQSKSVLRFWALGFGLYA